MKSLALLILFITCNSWANSCPDTPVGFGIASLENLNKNLKNSYSIQEQCQKHKDIFSDFGKQESDSDDMNKSIEKSQLVILGEEHLTPAQRDYGKLFDQIKKENNKINCLFLEFHSNDENAKALIEGQRPDSHVYLQYFELVTSAKANGTKVYAVDGRDPNKKSDFDMSTEDDNLAVFKNIKQLIDDKTCNSGVLLIGKAHVEHPQIQIDPKKSVKTIFTDSGYSATAINLVYTDKNVYRETIDQQWNWKICNEELFTPLRSQISIKRRRLNEQNGMVISKVRTFDYYLFLPHVEEKRLYP